MSALLKKDHTATPNGLTVLRDLVGDGVKRLAGGEGARISSPAKHESGVMRVVSITADMFEQA